MSRDNGTPPIEGCPGRDDLAAFTHGRLPLEKLESIAEHLSGCPRCESSLQALQAQEDTVLIHLRRDLERVSLLDELACSQLEDRARVIPLEETGTPTVSVRAPEDRAEGPPLPAAFGAYLLLERLGQGGMGIVYKARQQTLKRLVALKLVRAGIYASPEERARFQREGEAIARVRHPNVVQIHEFGEQGGQLYFSMELLEGGTLAHKLNGQPLPEREAAELVRALAQAVQAAHEQGIVHRDLKPGNVLFAADGTPKITDFGLAKVLDGEGSETQTDAILGTPSYMAPEQARGESRETGAAADVYALGAILYEALTGRPPFKAETRYRTMELVRTCEPEAPSHARRGLSRDLEAICLKCLQKEPAGRYASTEALANDLDRWLRGEATLVRPPSLPRRGWHLVRRHGWAAATVAALAVLALTASLAWFHFDSERPLRDIERRLARGEAVTLIDERQKPHWSRWRTGEQAAQVSMDRDSDFTIHSWTVSLLELLRDPHQDHYRIRAEVRHQQSDVGAVGLYFGYAAYPTDQGVVHYFVRLTFNDVKDDADQHARLPKNLPLPPPRPAGNCAQLIAHLHRGGAKELGWDRDVELVPPLYFQPAGYVGGPWHRLVVDVTPQGLQAHWDDRDFGYLSAADLVNSSRDYLFQPRPENPKQPFPALPAAEFTPRAPLGLYVAGGSASFRRVIVEPLNSSP